jgi:hypothetical protein
MEVVKAVNAAARSNLPGSITLLNVLRNCIGEVIDWPLLSHAVIVVHWTHHLTLLMVMMTDWMLIVSLMFKSHGSGKDSTILILKKTIKNE